MKNPALSRMLAVFLFVVSVITLAAAGLSVGKTEREHDAALYEEELLRRRTAEAERLRDEVESGDAAYAMLSERLEGAEEGYQKENNAYRQDLANYTATKAGLKLGQEQFQHAYTLFALGRDQFKAGYETFLQSYELFSSVYKAYERLCESLEKAELACDESLERIGEEPELGGTELSPEQVLRLAEAGESAMEELLRFVSETRDATPPDQAKASETLKSAARTLAELLPELENLTPERLAYEAALRCYEQADAALGEDGEGREAADELCRAEFGMSFSELGEWLEENRPVQEETGGAPLELSDEMLDAVIAYLPSDRTLLDEAVTLLETELQEFSERKAAYLAEPEAMGSTQLLLELLKSSLESTGRVLELIGPTLKSAWEQLEQLRQQMEQAAALLEQGGWQLGIAAYELKQSRAALPGTLSELMERKEALAERYESLSADLAADEEHETLLGDFRAARSQLLRYDEIYERTEAGGDLIGTARVLRAEWQARDQREYTLRLLTAAVMALGGLCGLLASFVGFEKLRGRAKWLPVALAVLIPAAGEAVSVSMGRGLWYSAIFVPLFALMLLPLIRFRKQA